jgi:hypothetical protein
MATVRKIIERVRTKACAECGSPFSYEVGGGTDRKYCNSGCYKKAHIRHTKVLLASAPQCTTPACERKMTRKGPGLCGLCYFRIRRTGSTAPRPIKGRYQWGLYVRLLAREHPLADQTGHVFEHRAVLYDRLGSGPQTCFWCGVGLEWSAVVVDHLNDRKTDNDPVNLVPSCNACNRARGAMLPFLRALRPDAVEVFIGLARKTAEKESVQREDDTAGQEHSAC